MINQNLIHTNYCAGWTDWENYCKAYTAFYVDIIDAPVKFISAECTFQMRYISTAYDVEGQQLYAHGYELDCKTVTVRWLIEWYESEASLVKTIANKHFVYLHSKQHNQLRFSVDFTA